MLVHRMMAAAAGRGGAGGGGGSYDADALAIFARMSPAPSTSLKDAMNTCILSLKSSSNPWSVLDSLYMYITDAESYALLNWINNGISDGTKVSTPTWNALTGYTGNNASNIKLWQFSEIIHMVNGVSGHVGGWYMQTVTNTNDLFSSNDGYINLWPAYSDNNYWGGVFSDLGGIVMAANPSGLKEHYCLVRSAAASFSITAYKGGTQVATGKGNTASARAPTAYVQTPGNYNANSVTIGCFHSGGILSSTQVSELRSALRTFMLARGASV